MSTSTFTPAIMNYSAYEPVDGVPGLYIMENAITLEQEQAALEFIDEKGEWKSVGKEGSRRYMPFGFDYEYKRTKYSPLEETPTVPSILAALAEQVTDGSEGYEPNSCLVNEYLRKTSIGYHTDKEGFGQVILGINLGDGSNMAFMRGKSRVVTYLPPRSAYIMSGECRQEWKHSILGNLTLQIDGKRVPKSLDYRRVSITYRRVQMQE